MKKKSLALLFTLINLTVVSFSQSDDGPHLPEYKIEMQINPDSSYLFCKAVITDPGDSVFFLTKGMHIKEISVNDMTADPQKVITRQPDNSLRLSLPVIPGKLEVIYSAKIVPSDYPKTISSVNMVTTGLVELSDQINWFPRSASGGSFNYLLSINLPVDYVTVTNGILSNDIIKGKRRITTWKTNKPQWNITMVAVPGMKKTQMESNGTTIEIYFSRLPGSYIDSMKNDISDAYGKLAEMYASKGADNLIRLVYSPRPAGGYARAPMIIVSEKFALEQRKQVFGYARDLRLNIHEIAHYWSLADAGTADDWLNEGLAEFSALIITEKIIGKSFSDILLKEYRGIVQNSRIRTAIVDTQGDSGEREINRYYKPALLLYDLREKYGDEKLNHFISSFYSASLRSGGATTGIFLTELEKNLGKLERDSLYEAITMNKWDYDEAGNNSSDTRIEPVYLGTWRGTLSQSGADLQFILNVIMTDGRPYPSLDSPDQGVKGIEVTALHVKGDKITFSVPVAGGVYSGKLDRNDLIIKGMWSQRGTDYPLNLSKLTREAN